LDHPKLIPLPPEKKTPTDGDINPNDNVDNDLVDVDNNTPPTTTPVSNSPPASSPPAASNDTNLLNTINTNGPVATGYVDE
jgi:hypothetical protein